MRTPMAASLAPPTHTPVSPAKRSDGVFAIVGPDTFLAEEALERLLRAAIGSDRQDSLQVVRGEEQTWSSVLDAARMRSFFATRRAVVVRGAEGLKGADDELAGYLADPTPGIALIFMAVKPDKRRTAWKSLLAKAEQVTAEPLKGQRLRARVLEELERRQLRIEPQGVEEILERVGQDLRRLMGELDKLEAKSAHWIAADAIKELTAPPKAVKSAAPKAAKRSMAKAATK